MGSKSVYPMGPREDPALGVIGVGENGPLRKPVLSLRMFLTDDDGEVESGDQDWVEILPLLGDLGCSVVP